MATSADAWVNFYPITRKTVRVGDPGFHPITRNPRVSGTPGLGDLGCNWVNTGGRGRGVQNLSVNAWTVRRPLALQGWDEVDMT